MRQKNQKASLKVIDLFCGCGGLSLGFQNVGFDILAAFDDWKTAINIYNKNFKHQVFECDLSKEKSNFFNCLIYFLM